MAKVKADFIDIIEARLEGMKALFAGMGGDSAERLMGMIRKAGRVFVTGKGRSGYVADAFAMRLMQMGFDVHVPGEATCPRAGRGDLMIAISCSGKTATALEMARIAHAAKVKIVVFTTAPESPLAKLADYVIIVPVVAKDVRKRYRYVLGPLNNTLFEEATLFYLDALVYCMLGREGIPRERIQARHANLE